MRKRKKVTKKEYERLRKLKEADVSQSDAQTLTKRSSGVVYRAYHAESFADFQKLGKVEVKEKKPVIQVSNDDSEEVVSILEELVTLGKRMESVFAKYQ